jgi:hypothetical protein
MTVGRVHCIVFRIRRAYHGPDSSFEWCVYRLMVMAKTAKMGVHRLYRCKKRLRVSVDLTKSPAEVCQKGGLPSFAAARDVEKPCWGLSFSSEALWSSMNRAC